MRETNSARNPPQASFLPTPSPFSPPPDVIDNAYENLDDTD